MFTEDIIFMATIFRYVIIENPSTFSDLSNREYQVFEMISIGKKVFEIANELNLSSKTVSTYRTRIMEKMKLSSNTEFTKYAIANKLINM